MDRVIRECEGLSKHVAKRYGFNQSAAFEDRCQLGRIAVWQHAVPKWDPDRTGAKTGIGGTFKSHGFWWMRSAVNKHDGGVRSEHAYKARFVCESELQGSEGEGQAGDLLRQILDAQECCYRKYTGMTNRRDRERELEEVREVLFQCVLRLTLTEQRVLFLAFWEEKTVREIAKLSQDPVLGMEPMGKTKVVDVRNRALERLQGMLTAKEFESWL